MRVVVRSVGRRSFATAHSTSASAPTSRVTLTRAGAEGADVRYSYRNVMAANQRAYNAAHFPSTPMPFYYKPVILASEVFYMFASAAAWLAMGAVVTSGFWAPWAIQAQRRAAEKRFAPLKGEIN